MRPMKALTAPLLALALLAAGCGDDGDVDAGSTTTVPDDGPVEMPARAPDLTGTITAVTPFVPVTEDCIPPEDVDPDGAVSNDDPPICTGDENDILGTILVEGDLAPERGRKISYTVTTETVIAGETADGTTVGTFADFAEGILADTWTPGPCAESYPEQCALEAIRVIG